MYPVQAPKRASSCFNTSFMSQMWFRSARRVKCRFGSRRGRRRRARSGLSPQPGSVRHRSNPSPRLGRPRITEPVHDARGRPLSNRGGREHRLAPLLPDLVPLHSQQDWSTFPVTLPIIRFRLEGVPLCERSQLSSHLPAGQSPHSQTLSEAGPRFALVAKPTPHVHRAYVTRSP